MKKIFKSSLSSLLAVQMIAVLSASVYAVDFNEQNMPLSEASAVAPRYTYLANITAGFSFTSDNKAHCTGSTYLYEDVNCDITVMLMKSTDGTSNWSAVKDEKWTKSYTTWGNHTSGGISSSELSSSYYYCTLTQVTIYDDNNKTLETASCWSSAYQL